MTRATGHRDGVRYAKRVGESFDSITLLADAGASRRGRGGFMTELQSWRQLTESVRLH